MRLAHRHALLLRAALEEARHHVLEVELDLFDVRRPAMISSDGKPFSRDFDLDEPIVEPPVAQLLAQPLARALRFLAHLAPDLRRARTGAAAAADRAAVPPRSAAPWPRTSIDLLVAHHADGDLDEVADHRLDVAADVADFGELRRFDLEERRLRQLGEPPRDLGLADAGRADHQDVLRRHFVGAAPAAASGGACDCAARSPRRAWPAFWPMTYLSSSATISRGRQRVDGGVGAFGQSDDSRMSRRSELFDREIDCSYRRRSRRRSSSTARRSRAHRDRCGATSALAAACAKAPPDPMPMMPSSGSIRSPVPDSRNVDLRSTMTQHRFEAAQRAIGAPVLGELDGGAIEIAAILLELGLEPGEQRKRIGRRAGKAGEDAVVVEPPDLPRAVLDDRVRRASPGRRPPARPCRGAARRGSSWHESSAEAIWWFEASVKKRGPRVPAAEDSCERCRRANRAKSLHEFGVPGAGRAVALH